MNIENNIKNFTQSLPKACKLIAVSKTQPNDKVLEAYKAGQRIFGENKVQELIAKHEQLPSDIEWHMIGHLQRNKVKYIAPFVSLIHSVDSVKLLQEINKQGQLVGRVVECLLQVHIATEDTKFGFSETELEQFLLGDLIKNLQHIRVIGLMGMATLTADELQIRKEFSGLKSLFERIKSKNTSPNVDMKELSMGMSSDYKIALEEGSTLIRIGTAIFGDRTY